ncbi:MAG TPA: hypothetical protein VNR18_14725 [Hyphomicrobiales bacterium]|nr:hypothetical protein [Hyphomicrobiales bacterium]
MPRFLLLPFCLLLGLSLCSCASPGGGERGNSAGPAPLRQGELRDFSGHWEKDFQLSDDFQNRLQLYVADIRRLYSSGRNGLEGGPALSGVNADAVNGLARFTEELTRMPLLDISQREGEVSIERQNDFTLHCRYADRQFVRSNNTFGSDVCGWERERLVFQMALGDGLSITHHFTLSPDGSLLNVTTRVNSAAVAVPLVISSYYQRFDAPEQPYDCLLTLTRSTVCSQTGTAR